MRSEWTNPLWRSTFTCMLTVGWAKRKRVASSPTLLGAAAREWRMARRVGSATALRRRATDSVRAASLFVTRPDADPDHHEIGKVEVEARTEEQAGDEVHWLAAFDVRSDPGQALPEDVTPRSYELIQ